MTGGFAPVKNVEVGKEIEAQVLAEAGVWRAVL